MFKYTANGNYIVREDFGVSVFDNELTDVQKKQTKKWKRVDATLPIIDCLSFSNPKKCTYTDDTKQCTKDKYGLETCIMNKNCTPSNKSATYCKKTGPICYQGKQIEDQCCPYQTTHYGKIADKKYCAYQTK
jgi:hypothetical protein